MSTSRAAQIRQIIVAAGGVAMGSKNPADFPTGGVWGSFSSTGGCGFTITIKLPTGVYNGAVTVKGCLEEKHAHAAMWQADLHVCVVQAATQIEAIIRDLAADLQRVMET